MAKEIEKELESYFDKIEYPYYVDEDEQDDFITDIADCVKDLFFSNDQESLQFKFEASEFLFKTKKLTR